MAKWIELIEKTDDLMGLTDIIENAANDDTITNAEYCKLYDMAIEKVQRI